MLASNDLSSKNDLFCEVNGALLSEAKFSKCQVAVKAWFDTHVSDRSRLFYRHDK